MSGYLSQPDYAFVYSRVPRICVSVIVRHRQGVALVRRIEPPAVGLWHLPGGRIFRGESIAQTVSRVLARELGITDFLPVRSCVGVIENMNEHYGDGLDIHNVDVVAEVRTETLCFSPEKGEGEPQWFMSPPPRETWNERHVAFLLERGFL